MESTPTPSNPQFNPQSNPQSNPLAIPLAIIVAGALIAGAIFFNANKKVDTTPKTSEKIAPTTITINSVSEKDHILGNLDADAVFVEYSDLECPACQYFQPFMKEIISKYGKEGRVAWVYRHYPLSIHPRAQKEAEAAECVAELAGEAAFWQFIHTVFAESPANNKLDPALLPIIAKRVSASSSKYSDKAFMTCLDGGKYEAKIAASIADGSKAGLKGTPYTVIILKKAIDAKTQQKTLDAIQAQISLIAPGERLSSETISFDETGKMIALHAAFPTAILEAIINTAAPAN